MTLWFVILSKLLLYKQHIHKSTYSRFQTIMNHTVQKIMLGIVVIFLWQCEQSKQNYVPLNTVDFIDQAPVSIMVNSNPYDARIDRKKDQDIVDQMTQSTLDQLISMDQLLHMDRLMMNENSDLGLGGDAEFDLTLDMNQAQCQENEIRECVTSCGIGNEQCLEGQWVACDAPQPTLEICDGIDNDCNGRIDDLPPVDSTDICALATPDEIRPCDTCSIQSRKCIDCYWTAWGRCELSPEANCMTGTMESVECGSNVGQCMAGQQNRICDESCQWSEWSECIGEVGASREICGNEIDEDCDGFTLQRPDEYEDNNTCETCTRLTSESPFQATIRASISSSTDVDYYCFDVEDRFSIISNESLEITLSNIANQQDYDLVLYEGEANCIAREFVARNAEPSNVDESIQLSFSTSTDNSASYILAVTPFGESYSCETPYNLSIVWQY